jgi:two-component system cell cycle sensor histidine kinase/response regulator CckA
LAFCRKQILQPRLLDLNLVVENLTGMLRSLIREDVELVAVLDPELAIVKADPNHIEQVIMNLAVNARDAMPQGGKLIIETANMVLDSAYVQPHMGVPVGEYVMLAVSDTGFGMDKEIQARIFDPFFTTKEQGKGTGLGLSTVYGIVKQSGGHILVYSEPGHGSTFKVFLPRVNDTTEIAEGEAVRTSARKFDGGATILLVEDEKLVRKLTRTILEMYGYCVLEAASAREALQQAQDYAEEIHILITDVVMPEMDGRALASSIGVTRRDMKVLYLSGYAPEAVIQPVQLERGIAFLPKPFTPEMLARKVREVLGA